MLPEYNSSIFIPARRGVPAFNFRRSARPGALPPTFFAGLQTSLVPSNGGSLTPTFTRALASYQIDFEGLYHLVPSGATKEMGARYVRNELQSTEDYSEASWVKGGTATVTGTNVVNLPADNDYLGQLVGPSANRIYVARAVLSGSGTVTLRLSNNIDFAGSAQITLTASPTVYSFKTTFNSTVQPTSEFNVVRVAGDTATQVTVNKLQVEDVTGQSNQNPSEYVSVGVLSAPYHGANVDGVKYFSTLNGNTVASNVVTEATGAHIDSSQAAAAGGVTAGVVDATGPKGLITEAAAQNAILWSDDISNAAWTKSGTATVTGTSVLNLPANSDDAFQDLGAAANATWTVSGMFSGTGTVHLYCSNFTDDSGSVAITLSSTPTFYGVTKAFNATVATARLQVLKLPGDTATAVTVTHLQGESGAIQSSPIPTTTVAVTRPADVDQYVSAGNLSATAMTIAMEITPSTELGNATVFHFGTYVDVDNYTAILSDGTNLIARKRIAGANTDATIAFARTVGTTVKAVARFDTVNGIDVWLGGTKGTGDATLTASQIGTNFQIGGDGNGGQQDYMEHRNFRVWTQSLSDAACSVLST